MTDNMKVFLTSLADLVEKHKISFVGDINGNIVVSEHRHLDKDSVLSTVCVSGEFKANRQIEHIHNPIRH